MRGLKSQHFSKPCFFFQAISWISCSPATPFSPQKRKHWEHQSSWLCPSREWPLQRSCETGQTSAWTKAGRGGMCGRLNLATMFNHSKANLERLTTTAHNPGTREHLTQLPGRGFKTQRRKYCLHIV